MAETKKTVKKVCKKPSAKTTRGKKADVKSPSHIGIVASDPWLEPYEEAIRGRHDHAVWMLNRLTANGKMTLSDFANGHEYYGLHRDDKRYRPA